jgi:replication-associated recombination protein RarA
MLKVAKIENVPNHLKVVSLDRKELGYGKGYINKYPHDFKEQIMSSRNIGRVC